MQQDPISITITCPSDGIITLDGQGIIVYAVNSDRKHLSAIAGELSIGDVAHLLCELIDSFGLEDIAAALSLAVLHRRTDES